MDDTKAQCRARLLAARGAVPPDIVRSLSRQIVECVVRSGIFRHTAVVLLYSPIGNEVETQALRTAAEAMGKTVYYARVVPDGKDIEFVRVIPGEALRPGAWGTAEPAGDEIFQPVDPALLIVPGVGFDRTGTRLGRGRGCYDRAVARLRTQARVVGLAFGLQLVPSLPREPHDQPIEFIATESGLLHCARTYVLGPGLLAG